MAIYLDGRLEQTAAPHIRKSIAAKERMIGQAFRKGNFVTAKQYAIECNEFEHLNAKSLVPSWPMPRRR